MSKQKNIYSIGLELERMKYPNTGLFHFCSQLGQHILTINNKNSFNYQLTFFIPKTIQELFLQLSSFIEVKWYNKFYMPFNSKFDLWHCTNQFSEYFPFKTKAKIILTIHDLNFLHENKPTLKVLKYKKSLQQKLNRADAIVTISEYVKEELIQNLDVKDKKVAVIYNGCNINSSVIGTKPNNIPSNNGFVFSIGTIVEKKNFHLLPALLKDNQLHLIIAGICQSEAYQQSIIEAAKSLGVAERVTILGTVTEAEKYWLLENCTAFAFPSYAEGFGLPVVEAMHFGKPIFLSQFTSLPEIGSDCAYYFNELDAQSMSNTFNEGLKDFNAKPQKVVLVKERAAFFTWEKAASEYLKLYETILKIPSK